MKRIIRLTAVLFFLVPFFATAAESKLHPFNPKDMWSMGRVSDPQVSPDGIHAAFVVKTFDMDKNTGNADIWLAPVDGLKPPIRLTASPGQDLNPRFMPDGRTLLFLSDRSGSMQVWKITIDGGEAEQLTKLPLDIDGFVVSPKGDTVALLVKVYPSCTDMACNEKRKKSEDESKTKARIMDRLPYRIWNSWRNEQRGHVLLFSLETKAEPRDLTPGDIEIPPLDLGCDNDVAYSPDGTEIAYTASPTSDAAWSTDNNVYVIPVKGGASKMISTSKGVDCGPTYSPDGKYLAYLSMERAGFESDAKKIMLYDRGTGKQRLLNTGMDLSVEEIEWSGDSKQVYFLAEEKGRMPIFSIGLDEIKAHVLYGQGVQQGLRLVPGPGFLVFTHSDLSHPPDILRLSVFTGQTKQLSDMNKAILNTVEMGTPEEFWFDGARGDKVHAFLISPPGFNKNKLYPLVELMHGGPQGAWVDGFHWRWNAQLYAAAGYVVLMVNFHGSSGYGQAFVDSVSGNWGTLPYEDVMKGLDAAIDHYKFIDGRRVGASGASFGGFLVNWAMGHTDRFSALVSHDGTYEQVSMYGATEELWFPEWELKGLPWKEGVLYDCFSPARFASRFTTPTLVVHGENDFRVPYTQGLQLFTALQRRGVPSKLLYFPDEDHFVNKPQNAMIWWREILDWLGIYLRPQGYKGPSGKAYSGPAAEPMDKILDRMPQCKDLPKSSSSSFSTSTSSSSETSLSPSLPSLPAIPTSLPAIRDTEHSDKPEKK